MPPSTLITQSGPAWPWQATAEQLFDLRRLGIQRWISSAKIAGFSLCWPAMMSNGDRAELGRRRKAPATTDQEKLVVPARPDAAIRFFDLLLALFFFFASFSYVLVARMERTCCSALPCWSVVRWATWSAAGWGIGFASAGRAAAAGAVLLATGHRAVYDHLSPSAGGFAALSEPAAGVLCGRLDADHVHVWPGYSTVQELTPLRHRATMVAFLLIGLNILGASLGSVVAAGAGRSKNNGLYLGHLHHRAGQPGRHAVLFRGVPPLRTDLARRELAEKETAP